MKTKTIWIFLLLCSTLLIQAQENLHYIAKQPSIVAAEQQAIHMLEERGSASSFGYFDLEHQYGTIPMLHSVFAVYAYMQGAREHLLVAVSSNPAKYNEYRASASKLSFFVFEKGNGQWKLKYEQIASSGYGHFGHPPEQEDVRFVQIGTDAYALCIDNFMATQGYGEGHTSLYLMGEEGMHEIFSGFTSGDNGGTEKHDTNWKTDISFDNKGIPLFILVAHTTGIIDGKQVNKTETYRYDGNQYKKIKRGEKKSCTNYTVYGVQQLNVRNRPGKLSKVIDRINRGETVCIDRFVGKWGHSKKGWISGRYLKAKDNKMVEHSNSYLMPFVTLPSRIDFITSKLGKPKKVYLPKDDGAIGQIHQWDYPGGGILYIIADDYSSYKINRKASVRVCYVESKGNRQVKTLFGTVIRKDGPQAVMKKIKAYMKQVKIRNYNLEGYGHRWQEYGIAFNYVVKFKDPSTELMVVFYFRRGVLYRVYQGTFDITAAG